MSYNNNGVASSFALNKYKLNMGPVEEANFKGELYQVRAMFSAIATGGTGELIVSTGDFNVFIAGRSFSQTSDRMELSVFVAPTFTGGTPVLATAYNGITPKLPAKSTGLMGATVTDDGIEFDEFLFLGDPSANPNSVGGSFRANDVLRMIPPNTDFLLKFKNASTTVPMDCLAKYLFFERDPSIPLS